MKIAKKLLSTMLALAVAITCVAVPAIPAQAAVRTSSYVYDAKTGINYEDKIRCPIGYHGTSSTLYSAAQGSYIAKATSSSSDLIVKVTGKTSYFGNSYTSMSVPGQNDSVKFQARNTISYFSTKPGTYTVTLTINDAKKKKIATKKVTVYVNNIYDPVKSLKYAGKLIQGSGYSVNKESGALKVTMNKTYKLQKLEVGTFDKASYSEYSPEPTYVTIKNGQTITFPKATKFMSGVNNYTYSSSYYNNDYICPVVYVRITYKDNLLNTLYTTTYRIYLVK